VPKKEATKVFVFLKHFKRNRKKMETRIKDLYKKISNLGIDETLSMYATKRLIVFNRLNAFGLLLACCWFIYHTLVFSQPNIFIGFLNILPIFITLESFFLMYIKQHKAAIYSNFILTPLVLSIASIQLHEGTILLFLIIYSTFPFFYNRKLKKILLQFSYAILLYSISMYFLLKDVTASPFIFSPLFQVIGIIFLFVTLYSIKIQIMDIEKQMNESKNALDIKNKELNELLGLKNKIYSVISHDIIVPLVGLKNLSENMTNKEMEGNQMREMFSLINDEISNTHDLFTNLLDWSKSQLQGRGKLSNDIFIYNMAELAIAQVKLQSTKKEIQINNLIDNNAIANANEENIVITLRNLLVNAIKFTPIGGQISLSSKSEDKEIYIYITDTGVGITPDKIKKIFSSEFYSSQGTNAETGNGFGLKICKELIAQHGGTVYCENSIVDEGSTFTIKLMGAKYAKNFHFNEERLIMN
jgi:signal transduction histidine kinase